MRIYGLSVINMRANSQQRCTALSSQNTAVLPMAESMSGGPDPKLALQLKEMTPFSGGTEPVSPCQ